MDAENPTAGDSGASITDRLERYLSAGDAPEPTQGTEQPATEAQAPEQADTETKPDSDAQAQDQGPQLTTAQLAQLFGVDEADIDLEDGQPVFRTKIDGKDGTAKLSDLRKTYQLQGHVENETRKAAEVRKAAEERAREVDQLAQNKLQQVEKLTEVAAAELLKEYQGINWPALEQQDPGQAALLKQKFQERNASLQGVFQNINAERAKGQQAYQQQRQAFLQQEAEKLPTVIPEWKDPAVFTKESQDIVEWGLKSGYSKEQLQALNESSAMHIATVRKAMLFDKLQQSKPAIENKVRTAPVIVKPGQAQPAGKDAKLNELRAEMKKTGGKGGTLEAVLMERFKTR